MDWRAVCRCDDVTAEAVTVVEVDGVEVGLVRVGGTITAFENICPHQAGPVCDGEVMGPVEVLLDSDRRMLDERFAAHRRILICPWHGYSFDVATGECITDRKIHLRRWKVREDDGVVYVTVPGTRAAHRGQEGSNAT